MKFEDSLKDDIVVFDLSGKIMGGDETTMFHGRIHEYMTQGKKKFLIDLAKVDWMNSVGLGMLIAALTHVQKENGRMALANIEKIKQILVITRLITVFENYDSREAAMVALKK